MISSAPVLKEKNKLVAYAPYVYEMDLWFDNVDDIKIVCPTKYSKHLLTIPFKVQNFKVVDVFNIRFNNIFSALISCLILPLTFVKIFRAMFWADHIHLRSPGNIALIGCIAQIFFPSKLKTVKYAGNWDPKSQQPWSYRLQKRILSNTFLTRRCKVLVYGKWESQTKNIVPFFTASYNQKDIEDIPKKDLNGIIKLVFVGTFSKGKQPLLSVKIAECLLKKGYSIQLDMYGEGEEFNLVKNYIEQQNLSDAVNLHKNQPKNVVKKAYQKSHFLIFISKSEGWPKVVAEAMFWQCLPISTKVSCVPYMLDYGNRGGLVDSNMEIIVGKMEYYINNQKVYKEQVLEAKKWSQQFTLERFESEIKQFL